MFGHNKPPIADDVMATPGNFSRLPFLDDERQPLDDDMVESASRIPLAPSTLPLYLRRAMIRAMRLLSTCRKEQQYITFRRRHIPFEYFDITRRLRLKLSFFSPCRFFSPGAHFLPYYISSRRLQRHTPHAGRGGGTTSSVTACFDIFSATFQADARAPFSRSPSIITGHDIEREHAYFGE